MVVRSRAYCCPVEGSTGLAMPLAQRFCGAPADAAGADNRSPEFPATGPLSSVVAGIAGAVGCPPPAAPAFSVPSSEGGLQSLKGFDDGVDGQWKAEGWRAVRVVSEFERRQRRSQWQTLYGEARR